jgi:REP element-mobilizing transposase RayT
MGRKRANPAPFLAYGGSYQTTRAGRARGRPLVHNHSMHFVLRSSQARGEQSFRHARNHDRVVSILKTFAQKNGVKLLNYAIHLNHLHLHLKLPRDGQAYKRFIRSISAAIAMAVARTSRWRPAKVRFWDRRPFSRPILGERARLNVEDYIEINKWEALGNTRAEARFYHAYNKGRESDRRRRARENPR